MLRINKDSEALVERCLVKRIEANINDYLP